MKFLPAEISLIWRISLQRNFIHWNIFHLIIYLKIEVKISPIIWMQFDTEYKFKYRSNKQIHFSNNQFMNGILTWLDFNSSFRNLQIILSDLRFRNTFQFVKYGAPIFFTAFDRHRTKSTNFYR